VTSCPAHPLFFCPAHPKGTAGRLHKSPASSAMPFPLACIGGPSPTRGINYAVFFSDPPKFKLIKQSIRCAGFAPRRTPPSVPFFEQASTRPHGRTLNRGLRRERAPGGLDHTNLTGCRIRPGLLVPRLQNLVGGRLRRTLPRRAAFFMSRDSKKNPRRERSLPALRDVGWPGTTGYEWLNVHSPSLKLLRRRARRAPGGP